MVTNIYRVYGVRGKDQEASFGESEVFSRSNKHGQLCETEIRNADLTGTHVYSEIVIKGETSDACDEEMDMQISDGLFETCPVGKVVQVHYKDPYKVEQLWKMLKAEVSAPDDQKYGAHLQHWSGEAKPIIIDAGALRALIKYYTIED